MTTIRAPFTTDLDYCPVCGTFILDFDEAGMEAEDGQRWCRRHYLPNRRLIKVRRFGLLGERSDSPQPIRKAWWPARVRVRPHGWLDPAVVAKAERDAYEMSRHYDQRYQL